MEIEDQFTKDYAIPDMNKEFYITPSLKQKNVSLLMKLMLLSKKYPDLLSNYKINCINEINLTTEGGWSALMIALKNKNEISSVESIDKLLSYDYIDVNIKVKNTNLTALVLQMIYIQKKYKLNNKVEEEDINILKKIVNAKADVNIGYEKKSYTYPALSIGVSISNDKIVKMLIDAKADVNHKIDSRYSLLDICGWKCDLNCNKNIDSFEKTLKYLIESKANINNIDDKKDNVLIRTCNSFNLNKKKMYKKIEILINAGVNIDYANEKGETALMSLSNKNDSYNDLLNLIIDSGANLDLQSIDGKTALHYATTEGDRYGEGYNNNIILSLIRANADINIKDNINQYPFDIALYSSAKSNLEIKKEFIKNKAKYKENISNFKKINKILLQIYDDYDHILHLYNSLLEQKEKK